MEQNTINFEIDLFVFTLLQKFDEYTLKDNIFYSFQSYSQLINAALLDYFKNHLIEKVNS